MRFAYGIFTAMVQFLPTEMQISHFVYPWGTGEMTFGSIEQFLEVVADIHPQSSVQQIFFCEAWVRINIPATPVMDGHPSPSRNTIVGLEWPYTPISPLPSRKFI
jgi:hypothetical protein